MPMILTLAGWLYAYDITLAGWLYAYDTHSGRLAVCL